MTGNEGVRRLLLIGEPLLVTADPLGRVGLELAVLRGVVDRLAEHLNVREELLGARPGEALEVEGVAGGLGVGNQGGRLPLAR